MYAGHGMLLHSSELNSELLAASALHNSDLMEPGCLSSMALTSLASPHFTASVALWLPLIRTCAS